MFVIEIHLPNRLESLLDIIQIKQIQKKFIQNLKISAIFITEFVNDDLSSAVFPMMLVNIGSLVINIKFHSKNKENQKFY